jgi:excisionase family DNA binding protein
MVLSRVEEELAEVLARHRRRLRADGVAMSPEMHSLEEVMGLLARFLARNRQEPTILDTVEDAVHAGGMALVVDFEECATELKVSRRTVERLARDGVLPTVSVGGRPRVRSSDLSAFVAGLEPRSVPKGDGHG